jgi:hypothetical protein
VPTSFRRFTFTFLHMAQRGDLHSCILALLFCPKEGLSSHSHFLFHSLLSSSPLPPLSIELTHFLDLVKATSLKSVRDTIVGGDTKMVLLSTLKWQSHSNTMQFWMAQERIDEMAKDNWFVFPVRLDTYENIGAPVNLKDILAS